MKYDFTMNFKDNLEGKNISLIKFNKKYIPELKKIANSEKIWSFIKDPKQEFEQFFTNYINILISEMEQKTQLPYIVVRNHDNKILGSTRLYDIHSQDKKIAIGFTWYIPEFWGSKINPEAKYLLLQYIFEELKFNRTEFHIDSRNKRSIAAVKKLGALEEALLRKHKIVQNDFVRDTVLCSIINTEWNDVKNNLLERIRGC